MRALGVVRGVAVLAAVIALMVLIGLSTRETIASADEMRLTSHANADAAALQVRIAELRSLAAHAQAQHRSYLISGDKETLAAYSNSVQSIEKQASEVEAGLATEQQRKLLAAAKQALASANSEEARMLELRRKDLRHRAFLTLASSDVNELSQQADKSLSQLAASVAQDAAPRSPAMDSRFTTMRNAAILQTVRVCGLLALFFGVMALYTVWLERKVARSTEKMMSANERFDALTQALSSRMLALVYEVQQSARVLVQKYGDFLPAQGQQYAQQIEGAAVETNELIGELLQEKPRAVGQAA